MAPLPSNFENKGDIFPDFVAFSQYQNFNFYIINNITVLLWNEIPSDWLTILAAVN